MLVAYVNAVKVESVPLNFNFFPGHPTHLPSPARWLVTMLVAPPAAPATHPVDSATPPL